MPTVACPFCSVTTVLPDPWTAPGYTCPHCHAAVAVAVPVAPPTDPFALDDAPARPRRRRETKETGAHPLLIAAGLICAVLSLGFFPPALGLAGTIFGATCLSRGSIVSGVVIVVLSLVFASIGIIWGIETAIWGRPLYLISR